MIIASGFSKCIISLIVLLWHFKNVWLRACVLPSFPREYISPWAGVFTCFWCLCCFESGLIACGKAVAHAHVAYVLKSCCFSFSYLASFHWSPICPVLLIYLHHPSHFLPPVERTACGAHRQKKARQAQDLTERIQRPPGPVEQQLERTPPPENGESTRICMNHHTLPPPSLVFWPYFHLLFISSGPASFPLTADVFEDDISSSSSPTEQHSTHQSPAFSSLPRLSGDQLLSDCSALVPTLNHGPCHAQVKECH